MYRLIALILGCLWISGNSFAYCDETGSYNKTWTLEAISRERGRKERRRYLKTLSIEQRDQISDIEIYPTLLMTCGMGFSRGLAKVIVNGKAGFIDVRGKILIPAKYNIAGRFSGDLAPVQFGNGKWGYIDKAGKTVIEPRFDWALIFREDRALVQVGEKWGFIDLNGSIVIEPQFYHADSFSEGLAHVQLMREKLYSGYIDKQGKWVIQPIFNGGENFNNGQAVVDQDVKDENGNYKYTESFLIDRKGVKLREVESSRTIKSPQLVDANAIDYFFDGYKTGYRTRSGKIIWKPTN